MWPSEREKQNKTCHLPSESFYYRNLFSPKCRKDITSAKDNVLHGIYLAGWTSPGLGRITVMWVWPSLWANQFPAGNFGPKIQLYVASPAPVTPAWGWATCAHMAQLIAHCLSPTPSSAAPVASPGQRGCLVSLPEWAEASASFSLKHLCPLINVPFKWLLSQHYFSLHSCHWASPEPKDITWALPFSREQKKEGPAFPWRKLSRIVLFLPSFPKKMWNKDFPPI